MLLNRAKFHDLSIIILEVLWVPQNYKRVPEPGAGRVHSNALYF